jgi:hypothetical protein
MDDIEAAAKTVLQKLAEYHKRASLDDSAEFFPILKTVIAGFVESRQGDPEAQNALKAKMVEFAREEYVKTWMEQVRKREPEAGMEAEAETANERFQWLYETPSEFV